MKLEWIEKPNVRNNKKEEKRGCFLALRFSCKSLFCGGLGDHCECHVKSNEIKACGVYPGVKPQD